MRIFYLKYKYRRASETVSSNMGGPCVPARFLIITGKNIEHALRTTYAIILPMKTISSSIIKPKSELVNHFNTLIK